MQFPPFSMAAVRVNSYFPIHLNNSMLRGKPF